MTQFIMICISWLMGIIAVYFAACIIINNRQGTRSTLINLDSISFCNRLKLVSRWGLRD